MDNHPPSNATQQRNLFALEAMTERQQSTNITTRHDDSTTSLPLAIQHGPTHPILNSLTPELSGVPKARPLE
jgi:hypothetical protein